MGNYGSTAINWAADKGITKNEFGTPLFSHKVLWFGLNKFKNIMHIFASDVEMASTRSLVDFLGFINWATEKSRKGDMGLTV